MLFDKFREVYDLPYNAVHIYFKRTELEDELIDKFGNLTYNRYEGWINKATGETYSVRYAVEVSPKDFIYSLYSYGTDYVAESTLAALMVFFIKYGEKPEEGTTEYYAGNYSQIFHDIVDKVYGRKLDAANC